MHVVGQFTKSGPEVIKLFSCSTELSTKESLSLMKGQLGTRSGPKVIKLFSCSTQLSMEFYMLINLK